MIYNYIHLILLSKYLDTAILAVQAFKISYSDFFKLTHYKISQFGKKKSQFCVQGTHFKIAGIIPVDKTLLIYNL